MAKDLHAIWQGSFKVFGVTVKCYVLNNGQKIIEENSMADLMEAMANPTGDAGDLENFTKWQKS